MGIVPENFPQQIRTGNRVRRSTSARPERSMQSCGQSSAEATPLQVAAPLLPPADTTSPEAAKEYFLKKFADVLVKKEDAPLKPMAGPPVHVHLKENASPSPFTPHASSPLLTRIR